MNIYHRTIAEATKRTDPGQLYLIEDCMRRDIFHSTLDWQTKAQLVAGARKAERLLIKMGELS